MITRNVDAPTTICRFDLNSGIIPNTMKSRTTTRFNPVYIRPADVTHSIIYEGKLETTPKQTKTKWLMSTLSCHTTDIKRTPCVEPRIIFTQLVSIFHSNYHHSSTLHSNTYKYGRTKWEQKLSTLLCSFK